MSERSRSPGRAADADAPPPADSGGDGGGGGGGEEVKLYVGNLSYNSDENRLREAFAGDVTDVFIPTDHNSGHPRGFAFVTYGSRAGADEAIRTMDQTEVDGRTIRVNESRPRGEQGGGGGGGYQGGGGGGGGFNSAGSSEVKLYVGNLSFDTTMSSSQQENVLYDLVDDQRWDDTMVRMKTEEGREELRRKWGKYDDLPLHVACELAAPLDLVEAMVGEYPEAVRVTDKSGHLPLHCTCDDISPPGVVRLLLDAYPAARKFANLHYLVDKVDNKRWDGAIARVRTEEGREELRRNVRGSCLPLHRACLHAAPLELVEAMVDIYPEAVRVTTNGGWLPLHYACWHGRWSSPRVVRLLLDAYPEGAKATDKCSRLPLHKAAEYKAPSEVLEMLIDAHPEGAATPDGSMEYGYGNRIPLHYLAYEAYPDRKEDVEKVEVLLRPLLDNEEACLVPDHLSGETPLDIGAKFGVLNLHTCVQIPRCPAEVIMKVARLLTGELSERDDNGNLPMHVTAANPNLNGVQVECVKIGHTSSHGEGEDDGDNGDGNDGSEYDGDGDGDVESDDGQLIEKDFIGELVVMHPKAAAALDRDGRFPLNLAIESGKKWNQGVKAITNAAKHVITIKDEATGLFPFMLTATGDDPCIDTVYTLFRRCPELKRYALD